MADNNNVGHECPTYDPVTTDPAPHQLPSDPGKTTAIEAAKARAAARKAARLAQQSPSKDTPEQNSQTPPHPSPTGGGSAPVAEPPNDTAPTPHQENNKQPEASPMTDDPAKQTRDAKLAAARAKSEERRIAHAKLKQHMRDTAIPIRPQTDDRK